MYERTYNSKVLKQNAPEEKKRKKRLPWKRIIWIFVGLIIAIVIVFLIRLPGLQIKDIEVNGTNVQDPEEVSLYVKSQIEGRYLYLLPRSSMLLAPTAVIAKHTKTQFPRFASVDIRRKGVDGLTVSVTEHEEEFLWCESQDVCFFMTSEGIVFASAPFFSGDAYEKIFFGEKGQLPFIPLSQTELSMIQILRERLPAIDITPQQYHLVSEHQLEIIFSHHGDSAKLLIDPTSNMEEMLEDLATGLNTEPLKGQFRDQKNILEYLDARFANKVVYKFK